MRLFLSSYGVGNQPQKLLQLIGTQSPKAALISNAADYHDEQEIVERVNGDIEIFKELGVSLEPLDLKEYFGKQDKLGHKLQDYDLIWVKGGNAFVLRRAMAYSGFDQEIKKLLAEDALVYGGYSAGACVLSPTLRGIDLCDDPAVVPNKYKRDIIWDGLGMVQFSIAPHYKSDHPEAPVIDRVVEYFEYKNMPFETLCDGEVILVDGEKKELLR